MSEKRSKGRTPNEKMWGELSIGESPERSTHASGLTSKFYTEEHDICDGQVKILRTKQSGQVYQFRAWISAEKKYIKKSLRTKNLEEAKDKGRTLYYTMMGKIESGQKLFTITLSELVERHLEYQQDRVDGGFITQGRWTTIRSQLNHLLKFLGKDRKLDTIKRERYKDYYLFRRKHHSKVQDVTLINERATIGHLYRWALEKGYVTQDKIPVWSELKRINVNSRTAFTREDYRKLYTYLKNWTKNISDERELYYRKLIRDFILIQSNTGLRVGEARRLKWNYVTTVKGKTKYPNVQIRVPAEISKVNKDRISVGMRGDFFKRIKTYSKHTHQQDYVFADYDTGEAISKKIIYKMWSIVMEGSGLKESPNSYTYYCLRHTFATYRLQYGRIDIRTISKIMGTTVQYIEKHYDSARVENMTDYITRVVDGDEDALTQVVIA